MRYYLLTLILILSISCCIENSDDESIVPLNIQLTNGTNQAYDVKMTIINSEYNEIFNKSFQIKSYEQLVFRNITKNIGSYQLTIILNDSRLKTSSDIAVNEYRQMVSIHIYIDNILISQKIA